MQHVVKFIVWGLLCFMVFVVGFFAVTELLSEENGEGVTLETTANLIDDREGSGIDERPGLEEYEKIETSMTESEATSILGVPTYRLDHTFNGVRSELIIYSANGEASSWITIKLVDGVVESKGQIDVKK